MNKESNDRHNLIAVIGPTASGKTALAARLAAALGSEIISADSRQIYRGMDIGTGKDLGEYSADGRAVPYHLIDIVEPASEFSVYDYQKRFFEAFEAVRGKGVIPIMAGGTGLYIEAVLKGYRLEEVPKNEKLREELEGVPLREITERLKELNPGLHNTTDLEVRERAVRALEIALHKMGDDLPAGTVNRAPLPEISPLVIGIRWERSLLRERITRRLRERLDRGLIEEVARLHRSGIGWDRLDLFGLEYRYVAQYLQGKLDRNDMFQKLNSAIHRFAKRQETWFRRMERKGVHINWIDGADYGKMREIVADALPA